MMSQEIKSPNKYYKFIDPEKEWEALLFFQTPDNLFKSLDSKVQNDLYDYFQIDKKVCNFQKAYNYAMGRTVGYTLLKAILTSENYKKVLIRNSQSDEDYGKPYAFLDQQKKALCLSLSHSNNASVAGYSFYKSIGLDIELIQRRPDNFPLLALNEKEYKNFLNSSLDKDFLLTCYWTAKEAVSKSIGKGLRIPIKELEVIFKPNISSDQELLNLEARAQYQIKPEENSFQKNDDMLRKFSIKFTCITHQEHRFILSVAKNTN